MKKYFSLLFLSLLVILSLAFIFKSTVFRYVLAKKVQRIEQNYGIKITYSNAKLIFINGLLIKDLKISEGRRDFDITFSVIRVSIPIIKLIKQELIPRSVFIDSLICSLSIPEKKNVSELKGNDLVTISNDTVSINPKIDLTKFLHKLKLPYKLLTETQFSINDFRVYLNDNHDSLQISASNLRLREGNIVAVIDIREGEELSQIDLKGEKNTKNSEVKYTLTSSIKPLKIPYIEKRFGLETSFDTLIITTEPKPISSDNINLFFNAIFCRLRVKHSFIADTPIQMDSVGLNLFSKISPEGLHIFPKSSAYINRFSFPFEASVASGKLPMVKLNVQDFTFPATNILESIPEGLFTNLDGISVRGNIILNLSLIVDLSKLDSLRFDIKLTPLDFKVLNYGRVDFRNLNGNFTHIIPLDDSTSKFIRIDSTSANFAPLERITPFLFNAVVVSEDGSFFNHKGFDNLGFSYALAQNIRNKRFARGGSTITMQLVKNLYLNRDKKLVRKIEEALIVWLIETQYLVSKERLLEIYLNIIDWGPNIQGITEAAHFYFSKAPKDLTLNESIFLASIIPRPSQFASNFVARDSLKTHMHNYFSFISQIMLERNMITYDDYQNLTPTVTLKGEALKFFLEYN